MKTTILAETMERQPSRHAESDLSWSDYSDQYNELANENLTVALSELYPGATIIIVDSEGHARATENVEQFNYRHPDGNPEIWDRMRAYGLLPDESLSPEIRQRFLNSGVSMVIYHDDGPMTPVPGQDAIYKRIADETDDEWQELIDEDARQFEDAEC